ncbi:MAG: phosphatidylserine decarboxylase [Phycisphaerales bacterium]
MSEITGRPGGPAVPDARLTPERGYPIIAREGWPIVGVFVLVTLVLWSGLLLLGVEWLSYLLGAVGLVLTAWCVWFFRDPERRTPQLPGVVVSPADGVVCQVTPARPPDDLGVPESAAAGMTRVAVFMNVFNVHVNRAPTDCTVLKIAYRPGKYLNASLDKASEDNERCALRLGLPDGREMACIQIAGLVARRIICRVTEGGALRAGQRYGLIRFGSRVDVYLPAGVRPRVSVGDRTVAGETVLAMLNGQDHAGAPGARPAGGAA